ncbi:MAG: hypothetical protein WA130_05545 [Candidatus Methanoperedens sp.]
MMFDRSTAAPPPQRLPIGNNRNWHSGERDTVPVSAHRACHVA